MDLFTALVLTVFGVILLAGWGLMQKYDYLPKFSFTKETFLSMGIFAHLFFAGVGAASLLIGLYGLIK